jgi:hypothetical protein
MHAMLRWLRWILVPGWGSGKRATDDQDWRLRAAFDNAKGVGDVLERLRRRETVLGSEVGGLLPLGVVLTRHGDVLFAYASARSSDINSTQRAIERVAHAAGLSAEVRVSHWDGQVRAWRQVNPPLSGREREVDEARARDAMRHETHELSFLVGRLNRVLVEGLVLDLARHRGLDCAVEEERRLLRVRLTFSVSGPAFKVDQFVDHARVVVNSNLWPPGAGASG